MSEILGIAGLLGLFDKLGKTDLTDAARQEAQAIKSKIESRAPGHLAQGWEITTKDGEALLSTDAPDAHRYENGYIGTDALGRHINQPPRPFVRPSLAGSGKGFLGRIIEALEKQQ